MSDSNSRLNKYEKRRKNTKLITILFITGIVLALFLLAFSIFGGDESVSDDRESDNAEVTIKESEPEENDKTDKETADENDENDEKEKEAEEEEEEETDDLEKEEVEGSDDNVVEAYSANWEPVGTEQEGEHTTQFEKDSLDWKEMEQAASMAADLDENDMMTWWIEGAGPQNVIATVSDSNETQTYRVFLTWVDNHGWQPTKVEVLKENDKK